MLQYSTMTTLFSGRAVHTCSVALSATFLFSSCEYLDEVVPTGSKKKIDERAALIDDYVESFQQVDEFRLFTRAYPNATEVMAYEFQEDYVHALLAEGEQLSGYKLGFTGLEPRPFGAPSPIYGRLFKSLEFTNGDTVVIDETFAAGAQGVELAIRFSQDALFQTSDFPLSDETILSLIDAVAPAFENPDLAFSGEFNYLDIIAQNTGSRFYVLGDFVPVDHLSGSIDDIPVTVTKDGEVMLEGSASDALGSQLNAVEFLLQQLAQEGIPVREGEIVATGSLGGDLGLEPGTFVGDFGEVGQVSFTFFGSPNDN